MIRHSCPGSRQLLGYAQGTIDEEEAERISLHVAGCENCAAQLDEACRSEDTLFEKIRALSEADVTIHESHCAAALRELERRLLQREGDRTGDRLGRKGGRPPRAGREFESAEMPSGATSARNHDLSEDQDDSPTVDMIQRLFAEHDDRRRRESADFEPIVRQPLCFGDYIVLEPIAEGGMGKVYKARHSYMDRIVALKVLADSRPADSVAVRYFEREVRLAAKLVHPNIVRSYDAGVADGVRYLVMEFVEGRTLSQIVKQDGRLPIRRACNYIEQAARGLSAAHAAGIVHRDVKPSNLILGADGAVKVLDMGVARVRNLELTEELQNAERTLTGTFLGTADYMAPEQARDPREATDKSDVYGLGCTLYRLLTGEVVFPGKSVLDRIAAHRDLPVPSLRRLRSEAPSEVEELFGRMLAKRADERPTMAEVADALNAIEKLITYRTDPEGAPKPSASISGSPPYRRNLKVVAAAAGAFFLFGGIWLYFKDKDGKTVAAVQVPNGGKVELSMEAETVKIGGSGLSKSTPHAAASKTLKTSSVDAEAGLVCELLAAKKKPVGLVAGAIPFDGPKGDGRFGANGLIVAAHSNWDTHGTQWSFRYRRSAGAEGLAIVHPFRKGNFRIVVTSTNIALIPGGTWGSAGFRIYGESGGRSLEVRSESAAVWPLSDDRDHRIISRCDAQGRYSFEVDGVVVSTTTIDGARPQEMKPPFEDKNCPHLLAIGQAALIVGPVDRGIHEVGDAYLETLDH